MHSRCDFARKVLVFWTLFIGVGALGGAAGMLSDPTGRLMGMDALLPYFQKMPLADLAFRDLTFSGWALLAVNGVPNLVAAGLLLRRRPAGYVLGGCLGVTLMLWICIQFYLFPANAWDIAYFLFGAAQAATGYAAWVFYQQERFRAEEAAPEGIGRDPRRLVVYFSRMGYVQRLALEEAARTGAAVWEVRSTERTAGTPGFWWCGRFGMHRWDMPIEPVGVDLAAFDHVTIVSPIWVFGLAAPIRAFCRGAAGSIREADYLLVHHQGSPYWNAAKEMDQLLGLEGSPARSVRCRMGRYGEVIARP